MNELQYTPNIWPLIIAAALATLLGLIMWRRPAFPGRIPFFIMVMGIMVWTLSDAANLTLRTLDAKLFFKNLTYVGITSIPASWLAFAITYTGKGRWLTHRLGALLAIEPVLVLVFAYTNSIHHLFRGSSELEIVDGTVLLKTGAVGPALWMHTVYSYALLVGGALLLLAAIRHTTASLRGQYILLLIGALGPWLANFIQMFLNFGPQNPNVAPLGFVITLSLITLSVYRYRFMQIVPIARANIIESMDDAMMVLDSAKRIVDINRAGLTLLGKNEPRAVIGQQVEQQLTAYPALIEQFRDVTEVHTEITMHITGEPRYFDLRISPLHSHEGMLSGRLFVLREITELKQATEQIRIQNLTLTRVNRELVIAREEAEEANRLKSQFLATMSHELRTPLNAVIGFSDLMATGITGKLTDKQTDYVHRIAANGERLLALINDVLDISKIEAGQIELHEKPFVPAELLDGVLRRMEPLATAKNLRFETALDISLPGQITGDVARLEQILTNLVSNAIRFTDEGSITINLRAAGDTDWAITVVDTGCGIPPHALQYIFDEFRQVDGSYQRERGGTGLGLAIVRKLAMLMGGTVNVTSEVDQGSTFRVQLPLHVPELVGATVHA